MPSSKCAKTRFPSFNDQQFALELLEEKHVLVTPGAAFNVPYRNHFRTTILPDAATLTMVFARIEALLDSWSAHRMRQRLRAAPRLVDVANRFSK